MKFVRTILLLLSICMLLPLASACKDEKDESNTESTHSEESEAPALTEPDSQVKAAIDSVYSDNDIDRTKQKTSISEGKSYTSTIPAGQGSSWLDTGGKMLTDGTIGNEYYGDPVKWVGFVVNNAKLEITLDLGEVMEGISDIESHHMIRTSAAINYIPGGVISVSNDNENFIQIQSLTPSVTSGDEIKYELQLKLAQPISARYIKFSFETTGGWAFITELSVYRYEEIDSDMELVNIYPDSKMPEKVTSEELWASTEPDYNDKINLLLGREYELFCIIDVESRFAVPDYNDAASLGKLTDGKYSSTNKFSDANFHKMTRGVVRDIVFDLTKTSALTSFSASFCNDKAAAVNPPGYINILVSEDGESFYNIGRAYGSETESGKTVFNTDFDKAYKARFVKVNFPVATHSYCDQMEVYGTKNIAGASTAADSGAIKQSGADLTYASPDTVDGLTDIILMYNARPSDGGFISEDESLTYFAYRDIDGNILDYMADGFLYLPFGAYDWSTGATWNNYINNTFTEGYNLDALNSAVATANEALGGDRKAKVFLSILHPKKSLTSFGDIDGDGIAEDMSVLEDRQRVVDYVIDTYLSLWEAKGYKNLELSGFYWYEEAIDYDDEHEYETLTYTCERVHEEGYKIIWIPYYQARGFTDWANLGFDLASMQPNYFWNDPYDRLTYNSLITKYLGMSTEFEVDSHAIENSLLRKRYKSYLKEAINYGYDTNAVHTYYISGGEGLFYQAYKSKDKMTRSIYDETYLFMKGKLDPVTPESSADQEFTVKVSGSLDNTIEFDSLDGLQYLTLYAAPRYGTLTLLENGAFSYKPVDKFGGEDVFYVTVENDYYVSEPIKITIKVQN